MLGGSWILDTTENKEASGLTRPCRGLDMRLPLQGQENHIVSRASNGPSLCLLHSSIFPARTLHTMDQLANSGNVL